VGQFEVAQGDFRQFGLRGYRPLSMLIRYRIVVVAIGLGLAAIDGGLSHPHKSAWDFVGGVFCLIGLAWPGWRRW